MRIIKSLAVVFTINASTWAFLPLLESKTETGYCECDWEPTFGTPVGWRTTEVWVDVVIILDTSEAMDDESVKAATELIDSLIGDSSSDVLTTDIDAKFYTRVGLIIMSDTAEVLYSLNMTKSDKLNGQIAIKKGVAQININDAVVSAEKMFNSGMRKDRETTRQVIYFMTNSQPIGELNGVNQFKTSLGIIIVNNLLNNGAIGRPGLDDLASNGYYYTNMKQAETIQLFCKANCYCLPDKDTYAGDDIDPELRATAGCFYANPKSIPWNQSKTTCSQLGNGGRLVSIHDENKQRFVKQMLDFDAKANYQWIGYSKADDGTWKWEDKSSNPYTHWDVANGEPNPTAVAKCAYMDATTSDLLWGAGNCNVAFPSVCEFPPCMAGNKC